MLVKSSELYGMGLDYTVMTLEKPKNSFEWFMKYHDSDTFAYSSNWQLAGQIIERDGLCVEVFGDGWRTTLYTPQGIPLFKYMGSTPLIAAMRCYVASKLGDEVEVPDELLNN